MYSRAVRSTQFKNQSTIFSFLDKYYYLTNAKMKQVQVHIDVGNI